MAEELGGPLPGLPPPHHDARQCVQGVRGGDVADGDGAMGSCATGYDDDDDGDNDNDNDNDVDGESATGNKRGGGL